MYSPAVLEHFQNPRNVGELPPPARTVEVENPACGDILRLSVRFEDDRIAQVGYKVRGCTASIAAGSVLTERILGQSRAVLREFSADALAESLELPAESRHAAVLCIDALRAILK